ncbi:MAG: hypothetical protein J6M02_02885 [Clostridia bacterium]|nr:hypothetical protein [Clostridia bacterium]
MRCDCESGCFWSLAGGLILGILLAVFGGSVFGIAVIGLGVALLFLILAFVTLVRVDRRDEEVKRCICRKFPCLLAGIFLTLITSVFVLVLEVFSAIAAFFVGWFFFFMLFAMLAFLVCVIRRLCD